MRNSLSYAAAGAGIGLFLGISTGVAAGGTAYNGAWVFAPIGAFVGWLVSLGVKNSKGTAGITSERADSEEKIEATQASPDPLVAGDKSKNLLASAFVILATAWNFHIELLRGVGVLPTFVEKPWLFILLPLIVSVFLPPFLVVYFVCYLGASHFGVSADSEFRAKIS